MEILWLVDRMAPPRTVIATPIANLSIADLAGCTNRQERCLPIAATADDLASAATRLLLRAGPRTGGHSTLLVSDLFRQLGFEPSLERISA
jgi:3-hydroxybutyryl-CoA dehydrogenase